MREWELWALEKGYSCVAGVDEAGRGPLAGPVVAAACILPLDHSIAGIKDSKQLSAQQRRKVFEAIKNDVSIHYGVGIVEVPDIDRINILQASLLAMKIAIEALSLSPDFVLVDGNKKIPGLQIEQKAIIQGDALSLSIGAASIIAKEVRDAIMLQIHQKWPVYGFDKHKGYATKEHINAINAHGPCNEHRKSFDPIKSLERRKLSLELF